MFRGVVWGNHPGYRFFLSKNKNRWCSTGLCPCLRQDAASIKLQVVYIDSKSFLELQCQLTQFDCSGSVGQTRRERWLAVYCLYELARRSDLSLQELQHSKLPYPLHVENFATFCWNFLQVQIFLLRAARHIIPVMITDFRTEGSWSDHLEALGDPAYDQIQIGRKWLRMHGRSMPLCFPLHLLWFEAQRARSPSYIHLCRAVCRDWLSFSCAPWNIGNWAWYI